MAAIDQTQANKVIDAILGTAPLTAFSGAAKIRLTTTTPTGTAAATQLTGTGYTAGGSTITFGSASAGSAANTGSAITWTNGSGSPWSIVGAEIWDSAGTPLRWWYGTFTGQPITVPNGATFSIATGAVTAALS